MTEPNACALCGLPLTHGNYPLDTPGGPLPFCCNGCRQVYVLLSEAADSPDPTQFRETDLYRECVSLGIIPANAEDLERMAAEPDARSADDADTGVGNELALTLDVGGMWCSACAWVIERVLNNCDGVSNAACNFSTDRVDCRYHPARTSPDALIQVIRRLGYSAALPGDDSGQSPHLKEFIRFAASAFLTMNAMMLSAALYTGFFTELEFDSVLYISVPLFLLSAVVYAYGGWHIHQRAVTGLLAGAPGMETLVSMGATSAFAFSIYNMLHGSIHLYFDTAAMLITLVLLGKFLENRAKAAVKTDLDAYFRLLPNKVRICTDEQPLGRYVPAAMLKTGDTFRVVEGETVVADGVLVEGAGDVDESSLTGEPRALRKTAGSRLISGSRLVTGDIRVRAQQVGDGATLQQMIQIMQQALMQKTPMEGKTERLLRWFVPLITGLAVLTTLGLVWRGIGVEEAVIRGVTVLVIACPCALGVAIPLARVAGVSLAARQGILIRRFSAFDRAERIDTVALDKTGTVTHGKWRLLRVIPDTGITENEALKLALSVESTSTHPIADEIRRASRKRGLSDDGAIRLLDHQDGVEGVVNGQVIRVGTASFTGITEASGEVASAIERRDAPESRVYVSVDDRPAATLVFGDRIRSGAASVVQHLKQSGLMALLLSGDASRTTSQVGNLIGISRTSGDLHPDEKAMIIETLQAEGRQVAMVGDGINDGPAMATADLAIAMYSGSALNEEMADVSLMRSEPSQLTDFMRLATGVRRKIRQNLALSFAYNLISIPVAISGMLSPLVAVTAMLLSSLSVISNTLLLIHRGHRRQPDSA